MADSNSYKDFVLHIAKWLMTNYWHPMWKTVSDNPELIPVIPGFLIRPEKLIYYMGRTHIGIEYIGPERLKELPRGVSTVEAQCFDYSLKECNLLDEIIGFNFGGMTFKLPLPPISSNLVLPTNAGADELQRLNWNWSAQDFIVGFNTDGVKAPEGQFTRVINARFFDADASGLKVRYIRWLDLIPCEYDDSGDELDTFSLSLSPFVRLAEHDPLTSFPLPEGFRLERLERLNRFIELLGDRSLIEQDITGALDDDKNRFIISMRFSAKAVRAELLCEWQGTDREAIQPDFFVVGPNGFADIVEFKLPNIDQKVVVGRTNREAFSAEINSYIAQTRVYREYFDDPRNRAHVKEKYGFEVYKPRRILVIGRRWHFNSAEWRTIAADYNDLTIMTYDDLIDGVVAQFYN